jgi:mono/diheme cytochrome c family protein
MSRGAALCALLMACSGLGEPPFAHRPDAVVPGGLELERVAWNSAGAPVGRVAAVAERGEQVAVFSDRGALVFAGGVLSSVDTSVTAWRAAATVPAVVGDGEWVVGVAADGRLYRIRDDGMLDPVSDRYALLDRPVRGVIPLGSRRVGFVLEGALAVADGVSVVTYDVALASWAGKSGALAGVLVDGQVARFDLPRGTLMRYRLPGAVAGAFDATGLVVAGPHALARDFGAGELVPFVHCRGTVRGLAAGGGRVWVALGDMLSALEVDGAVLASAVGVGDGAVLQGSPSGDVWVLTNGELARFGVRKSGDESLWRSTVQPVYARHCSTCHGPGGSSGIDLSSYAAWRRRRDVIHLRVLVKRDMPQGTSLEPVERRAVADWTDRVDSR